MKHSCQNCKYHNIREYIKNEYGKHECWGRSLICAPIVFGYEADEENDCEKFKEKDGTKLEDIEKEWHENPFMPDKSTVLFTDLMLKREEREKGDAKE